jgi:hypothetical protein
MINWIKNLFKKKEDPIPLSPYNWSVSRTNNRVVYKIPIGNLSKEEAEKQLKQLISNYQTALNFAGMTRTEKIKKILNKIQPKEEN